MNFIDHTTEVKGWPTRAAFWWMCDNHTFARLDSPTLDEIIEKAEQWRKKDPHGALCPVTLLDGDKELGRIGKMCHGAGKDEDRWQEQLQAWRKEVESNPHIGRLLKKETVSSQGAFNNFAASSYQRLLDEACRAACGGDCYWNERFISALQWRGLALATSWNSAKNSEWYPGGHPMQAPQPYSIGPHACNNESLVVWSFDR